MSIISKSIACVLLLASLLTGNSGISEIRVSEERQEQTNDAPERVSKEAVPARIAFTSNRQLWLLDGSDAESKPVQVTKEGSAEIVGWSHDGEWLLYVCYPEGDLYDPNRFLWAVNKDGSKSFQIDDRPILANPKWSPTSLQFAYVAGAGSGQEGKDEFIVKEIRDGKVLTVSQSAADFADFAWMPDGRQFLVSLSATAERPMTLAFRQLSGEQTAVFPIAEKPDAGEDIYPWAPVGMQVSPNGRLVAYYVRYNAASLSADGVPVQLFDLGRPTEMPIPIGSGLAYPKWLSWAPDGSRLAFIEGTGREATEGKRLRVVDRSGNVVHETEEDKTASFPVWTLDEPFHLYFAGGTGVSYPDGYEEHQVLVPGQRIVKLDDNGTMHQVTHGTDRTADLFPSPAPDGKQLLFVRLDEMDRGSLFLLKNGTESELVRSLTGSPGYYANYLPKWTAVYWE